ncbi:MAG TPA: response regulator [Vicinamibacterales bacterium]|nr:response regulator [Vicinamibacterales bacterium]
MSLATPPDQRPRLLFVDDEQRVLNSMRVMFRRQFDLFLASHGAEALDIVKDKDIDVIVADHRMPKMTGVEVLSKVRALSPRTVRILLTGYADLDAVEGSINESEVFRFLTKPCAPKQLRETIELAAKVARQAPTPAAPSDLHGDTLEIIMESDTVTEVSRAAAPPRAETAHLDTAVLDQSTFVAGRAAAPAPVGPSPPPSHARLATGLGIVVFSSDAEVIDTVQKAVGGRLPVHTAGNIVQVVRILNEHRPGVLVTDVSRDKATIQSMTARLKELLPQLVTIVVSQHRDVLDMAWLINHGQIFRFLRKPLSAGHCALSLQAALQQHRLLLKNPDLAKRHEVDAAATAESGIMEGVMAKLRTMKRLWTSS